MAAKPANPCFAMIKAPTPVHSETPEEQEKVPYKKRAIFRESKEIKWLHGGVDRYAAQVSTLIDAEITEKGRFRTDTN